MSTPSTTAPPSDLGKIARCIQAGDGDAFTDLYTALSRPIFDFLVVLTRDRHMAEDLSQQTFLKVWQEFASLQDAELVRPWVYRIARNVAYDYRKARGVGQQSLDEVYGLEAPEKTPEAAAISHDAVNIVWNAASSLDATNQEALSLSLRHGLTNAEIGEVLGISPSTAKDLVIRSREALGNAVRILFVSRSQSTCPKLRALIPGDVHSLTQGERRSVDRHMRKCGECQVLASKLTRAEELFGTIILFGTRTTSQPFHLGNGSMPHGQPMSMSPAHPASHSASSTINNHARSLTSKVVQTINRNRLISASVAGALLIALIGGLTYHPIPPPPVAQATPTPAPSTVPASTQLWTTSFSNLASVTSYNLAYTKTGQSQDFSSFNIHVDANGDWWGSVADATRPTNPLDMYCTASNQCYVHGDANFVADADFFSLTTAQAQSLGNGWLDLGTIQGTDEASVLIDAISPYTHPSGFKNIFFPPTQTPTTGKTTWNGQPVTTLNDGTTTLYVSTSGTPFPVHIADSTDIYDFTDLNVVVASPSLASVMTWKELTG